jgi:hypothetical protein
MFPDFFIHIQCFIFRLVIEALLHARTCCVVHGGTALSFRVSFTPPPIDALLLLVIGPGPGLGLTASAPF